MARYSPHMPGVAGSSPASSTTYPRASVPTLARFVREEYWPAVSRTLAPDWRQRSERILAEITHALGLRELDRVTPRDVWAWWGRVQSAHRAPRTANLRLIRLRHLYRVAGKLYGVPDPTTVVSRLREPRAHAQYFTEAQRAALLAHANARLHPYVLWGLYTGARRRSLFELRREDVSLAANTITFRRTKTGEDHVLPLLPVLRDWYMTLAEGRAGDEFVLPRYTSAHAITRAFKRLCQRIGMPAWAHFHSLRHDVASRLAMAGANTATLQAVGGWRDPRMVARYAHLSQEAVRKTLESVL